MKNSKKRCSLRKDFSISEKRSNSYKNSEKHFHQDNNLEKYLKIICLLIILRFLLLMQIFYFIFFVILDNKSDESVDKGTSSTK